MLVMKFGGSSVGDGDRMAHVAQIVVQSTEPTVVVTSAMGGATDALIALGEHAACGHEDAVHNELEVLLKRHELAACDGESEVAVRALFGQLRSLIGGVLLLREQTPRSRAMLAAFGERLAAALLSARIRGLGLPSVPVDAATLVCTDDNYLEATVDEVATRARVQSALVPLIESGVIPVVTGFIGASPDGVTTLLGRGGSDDTAALLGACLDARAVWIWTDVDGILSADPRIVPDARSLARVSYQEAAEMSYFGAKVVHPKTMMRVDQRGIPLVIRSTFKPQLEGTVIGETSDDVPLGVKTVTSMRGLALVTIEGRGLAGTRGVARRIFAAAETSGANIVMISQASSEQAVSLVVRDDAATCLITHLKQVFAVEIAAQLVHVPRLERGVGVVSAVGEGMAGTSGTSGRLFSALGRTGVNVRAIAQGASELSISVALREADLTRAVRAVHAAFGLTVCVDVVLFGCGRVGLALLEILRSTAGRLAKERGLALRVIAAASSRRSFVEADGVAWDSVAPRLEHGDAKEDVGAWLDGIDRLRRGPVVLVDLTAADTTDVHLQALARGMHVVTANKKPLSGPMSSWHAMVQAVRSTGARYGYETTFGAGLPVLHTLKELMTTGDQVIEISGCLSGTLGYICTRLDDGTRLEDAIKDAANAGYTEPDPREDLSGRDVARKALIIARAMGMQLEPDVVSCEPFLADLEGGLDEALRRHGEAFSTRVRECKARGEVLRYVAVIREDLVRVGLRSVDAESPEGGLRGPDNLLVFRTTRYAAQPLVVRGPGAGAEVTAAGVLGDIIRVVSMN